MKDSAPTIRPKILPLDEFLNIVQSSRPNSDGATRLSEIVKLNPALYTIFSNRQANPNPSYAAVLGDTDAINQMLEGGTNPDELLTAIVGDTPLHFAAMAGYYKEISDIFHKRGLNIAEYLSKPNDNGFTPVHLCAMSGDDAIVKDQDVTREDLTRPSSRPSHHRNHFTLVRVPNAQRDKVVVAPHLNIVAEKPDFIVVRNNEVADHPCFTPFQLAVICDNLPFIEALLKSGISPRDLIKGEIPPLPDKSFRKSGDSNSYTDYKSLSHDMMLEMLFRTENFSERLMSNAEDYTAIANLVIATKNPVLLALLASVNKPIEDSRPEILVEEPAQIENITPEIPAKPTPIENATPQISVKPLHIDFAKAVIAKAKIKSISEEGGITTSDPKAILEFVTSYLVRKFGDIDSLKSGTGVTDNIRSPQSKVAVDQFISKLEMGSEITELSEQGTFCCFPYTKKTATFNPKPLEIENPLPSFAAQPTAESLETASPRPQNLSKIRTPLSIERDDEEKTDDQGMIHHHPGGPTNSPKSPSTSRTNSGNTLG
jgi:ankyrin repeat protein